MRGWWLTARVRVGPSRTAALGSVLAGALSAVALISADALDATAERGPTRTVQQNELDYPVHLPLTMQRAVLADIPTVRPVEATATPHASSTPSHTPTMDLPNTDLPPSVTPTDP